MQTVEAILKARLDALLERLQAAIKGREDEPLMKGYHLGCSTKEVNFMGIMTEAKFLDIGPEDEATPPWPSGVVGSCDVMGEKSQALLACSNREALSLVVRSADELVNQTAKGLKLMSGTFSFVANQHVVLPPALKPSIICAAAHTWTWDTNHLAGLALFMLTQHPASNIQLQWMDDRMHFRKEWPALDVWENIIKLTSEVNPGDAHHALANQAAGEDTPTAVKDRLARCLLERLKEAKAALRMDTWPPPPVGKQGLEEGGMLWLDYAAALFLEGTGPEGKRTAATLRDKAAARWKDRVDLWKLWEPTEWGYTRFARLLCRCLWDDKVRKETFRDRALVCMPRAAATAVVSLLCRPAVEERQGRIALVTQRGKDVIGEVSKPQKLPAVAVQQATLETTVRNLWTEKVLTLPGIEALKYVIRHAWLEAVSQTPHPEVVKLKIAGGWEALAAAAAPGRWQNDRRRCAGGQAKDQVTAAIKAMSSIRVPIQGDYKKGSAWLMDYDDLPATGRNPSALEITCNAPLLPGFEYQLAKGPARLYVPVPALPPPFASRRKNEYAKEAVLHLLFFRELAERAVELVEQGGWELDEKMFRRLAEEAGGLPKGTIARLLETYLTGGAAPLLPVLERTDSGLFVLGKAYQGEQESIQKTGRLQLDSSKSGKISARKRQAERSRTGKTRQKKRPPNDIPNGS